MQSFALLHTNLGGQTNGSPCHFISFPLKRVLSNFSLQAFRKCGFCISNSVQHLKVVDVLKINATSSIRSGCCISMRKVQVCSLSQIDKAANQALNRAVNGHEDTTMHSHVPICNMTMIPVLNDCYKDSQRTYVKSFDVAGAAQM